MKNSIEKNCISFLFLLVFLTNTIHATQQWDVATSLSETNNPFGPFSLLRYSDKQLMVVTSDVYWYPWYGPGWGIPGNALPQALLPSDHGNHGEATDEMMIQPDEGFAVRWTSPIEGWVEIDFYYGQGGWNQTTQTGFKFYVNETLISEAYIPWPVSDYLWPGYKVLGEDGSAGAGAMTQYVQIGDTLDFTIVSDGPNGDGGGGSCPIALHLTIVNVTFYELTMAANPSYVDTVEPNLGVHQYDKDTYAHISAQNYAMCPDVLSFDHWVGDGIEDPCSPSTRVFMDQNRTVTAVFVNVGEECFDLTILTDPVDIGAVTTPSPGIYQCAGGGTEIPISAEGYVNCPDILVFDHWEGDVIDPTSEETIVVIDQDNKTITAVFADGTFFDECQPLLPTDINQDCIVNFVDFALFVANWLEYTGQY